MNRVDDHTKGAIAFALFFIHVFFNTHSSPRLGVRVGEDGAAPSQFEERVEEMDRPSQHLNFFWSTSSY